MNETRKVFIKTYGCQMNVYDSERMADTLAPQGWVEAGSAEEADLVILNTCHIREKASEKVYSELGRMRVLKAEKAERGERLLVGVAGCVAQAEGREIARRAPVVDMVFGPQSYHHLPGLIERTGNGARVVETEFPIEDKFDHLAPPSREKTIARGLTAFLTVQEGCDKFCTFCVVPYTRGAETSRPVDRILAEARRLAEAGVREVTLLGQNVNSYGVEFGDRQAFSKLLRAAGEIEGIERIRFTSPHPAAFTDDVIDAMAETPAVMPQLHMPLQSGSDRILKAMRRSYRSSKFLGILDRVRERIPHAAITTDIIVGFPGETDEDFEETMRVVEASRFSGAFTFQYSIREGTPAATMEDQVPKEVVQERYNRLIALQERISLEENQKQVGREVEVLVSVGEGKKDAETHRLTGRAQDNRLVHFELPEGSDRPRPGDVVTVTVTHAAPFHLLADAPDGAPLRIRRTRGGDAWDRAQSESCAVPAAPTGDGQPRAVSLGLPTLRVGV